MWVTDEAKGSCLIERVQQWKLAPGKSQGYFPVDTSCYGRLYILESDSQG